MGTRRGRTDAPARNVDLVARLGADDVIDYTTIEVTDGIARFDLVLELAGNRRRRDLARILTPTGTLVVCGARRDTDDLQRIADWLGATR